MRNLRNNLIFTRNTEKFFHELDGGDVFRFVNHSIQSAMMKIEPHPLIQEPNVNAVGLSDGTGYNVNQDQIVVLLRLDAEIKE